MNTYHREGSVRDDSPGLGTKQVVRDSGSSMKVPDIVRSLEWISPWGTTIARVILGLVLAWFGYHELMVPRQWTGYVPILSASSQLSQILVLAHGAILCVLAIGLIAGIAPKIFASIATLVMLEIVVSLTVTAGLSDLVLRDFGVMGLAISVASSHHERLVLHS